MPGLYTTRQKDGIASPSIAISVYDYKSNLCIPVFLNFLMYCNIQYECSILSRIFAGSV